MQCANHLKQIGIGIHNFHDTRLGLPPNVIYSYGSDSRMTLWGLIYPFVEQIALYDQIITTSGNSDLGVIMNDWWRGLSEEDHKAFGSVPIYHCPSRRSGAAFTPDKFPSQDETWFNYNLGPQGDYAFILSNKSPQFYVNGLPQFGDAVDRMIGPFRPSLLEPDWSGWKPRDTFAWWQDGTSNQIIIGEKHIPSDFVGRCDPYADYLGIGTEEDRATTGDCSYLNCGYWRSVSSGRPIIIQYSGASTGGDGETGPTLTEGDPNDPIVNLIAKKASDYYPGGGAWGGAPLEQGNFGSAHPGISQFLLGDGAVYPFPVTISRIPYARWAAVNDGATVTLP